MKLSYEAKRILAVAAIKGWVVVMPPLLITGWYFLAHEYLSPTFAVIGAIVFTLQWIYEDGANLWIALRYPFTRKGPPDQL